MRLEESMEKLRTALLDHGKGANFWSIFLLRESHEEIGFRKGVQEPVFFSNDQGVLVTVMHNGGIGYASTQDVTIQGVKRAFDQAFHWANQFSSRSLLRNLDLPFS